ncbi:MAG: NAD(P)H-quinone oxidoreductase [Magnetovibrio sp.]|nr:NAD(P)H-quinone oxidoreductase [Magnetovibrio sp.]
MLCIEIAEPGGPEVLSIAERDTPRLSKGEILVKVVATGVNGPDLMQRRGLYPAPKHATDVLGLEIAGHVAACGKDVKNYKEGDKVCALANGGGYAEFCTVKSDHCLPIPRGMTLANAASLPETYFTIWSNIFMGAALKAGEVYLVHGGAGGLGITSILLGKAFGATVIAIDSPKERIKVCSKLGADRVIDYIKEDFVDISRTEFGGADVILDIIGGDNIARNIKAAKHDARIVQLAFAEGSSVKINLMPIMLKRLSYTGSTLRSRSDQQKTMIANELREKVWPLFETGDLKAVVNTVLPLSKAHEAHTLMESAKHIGKIVLNCEVVL